MLSTAASLVISFQNPLDRNTRNRMWLSWFCFFKYGRCPSYAQGLRVCYNESTIVNSTKHVISFGS